MNKMTILCLFALGACLSCSNGNARVINRDSVPATIQDTSHSSSPLPAPSKNSDATNPSIPDTTIFPTDSKRPKN